MKTSLLFSAPPNVCREVLQLTYYSFWFARLLVCFRRARVVFFKERWQWRWWEQRAGGTSGLCPIPPRRDPDPLPRWACPAASSQLLEGTRVFHGNSWKMDLTSPWKIANEHVKLPSLIILRRELMSNSTVVHHPLARPRAASAQCFLHHHFLRSFHVCPYLRERKLGFGILLPGAR